MCKQLKLYKLLIIHIMKFQRYKYHDLEFKKGFMTTYNFLNFINVACKFFLSIATYVWRCIRLWKIKQGTFKPGSRLHNRAEIVETTFGFPKNHQILVTFYADNPMISPIYVTRELLGFRVRLAQGVDGRER